jgi:hypothetical protein
MSPAADGAAVAGLLPLQVDQRLMQLKEAVVREVKLQEQLMSLQGLLEPILAGALMGQLSLGGSSSSGSTAMAAGVGGGSSGAGAG